MVLVHNSNLTTIKDFSPNAFCKNATQKKKSTKSIHPDTLIGTCYYRTANKYVDQII
jgi:hypothetical protein